MEKTTSPVSNHDVQRLRELRSAADAADADHAMFSLTAEVTFRPRDFGQGLCEVELSKKDCENKTITTAAFDAMGQSIAQAVGDGWSVLGLRVVPLRLILMQEKKRIFTSFRPTKCLLEHEVRATYSGPAVPDLIKCVDIDPGQNIVVLLSAFIGAQNLFLTAPSFEGGISGACFGRDAINDFPWPMFGSGLDLYMSFGVKPTILTTMALMNHDPDIARDGYNQEPVLLTVAVKMNMFGSAAK